MVMATSKLLHKIYVIENKVIDQDKKLNTLITNHNKGVKALNDNTKIITSIREDHNKIAKEFQIIKSSNQPTDIDNEVSKLSKNLDTTRHNLKIAEKQISKLQKENKELEDRYEDIFDNLYKRLQFLETKVSSEMDEVE